ncbi:MipA/OmpV family protein [Roseateles cellulosilyticus]|uniref:MipA/OmpV family protein n=1 Tax=Pelomonas cellulosilytica TaxID=2906762 RepID=A0ABS8Y0L2_9BURK|nr:MipA/OmpV family protein [Pelomonas sp. P8]MCE4557080.1 MipA/OmpV family protein [Pelomonas sp. P8]
MTRVSRLPLGHRCLMGAALLIAGTPAAHAAGSLLLIDAPPATTTWSGGLSVRGWPRAPGSGRQRLGLLPAIDYESPTGFFAATDAGIGWNLAPALLSGAAAKDWQLGLRWWPQSGRPRRESPPGVDSLGTRVITEAFANVQVLPVLLLQSGLSWGSGRHRDGGELELGATSGIPLGDDLLAVSVAATYANAAHLRGSFGVRATAPGGLPEWHPGSGWQDWSIAFSGEHKFSADWSVSGQWLQARLIGQAARSPLAHSRDQPSFMVSLWHRF